MSVNPAPIRRRFDLRGQVQGVGFRPYVYRLATTHGLGGHVANNSNGAVLEVEGEPGAVEAFEHDLIRHLPPLAKIADLTRQDLEPLGETTFRIRASQADPERRPEVTPDAATCADCLRELLDPGDRRYRYPFINCTNCGPRYSIIRSVPYDRPRTTMAVFELCPPCAREYGDPADRRFHAQPNACAVCGPRLRLCRVWHRHPAPVWHRHPAPVWHRHPAGETAGTEPGRDSSAGTEPGRYTSVWHRLPAGETAGTEPGRYSSVWHRHPAGETAGTEPGRYKRTELIAGDPIRETARLLDSGQIVAVKGIGGYHLACRADLEEVVRRLRELKLRDGKPLAVMVPDLATARNLCRLTPADEDALTSPAAPIVLARVRDRDALAPSVARGCRDFGLMLPYAPLHHLLFAEGLGPLVMTSANLAGQPLTYRDDDALDELADVADAFLLHNREIFRPIDDSVVFTFRDEVVPLRRARGYAPRPLRLAGFGDDEPLRSVRDRKILAVGGELKSTCCLLTGGEAVLSEHLGDLSHPDAFRHFVRAIDRLKALCGFEPDAVACDLHPQYLATEYARGLGLPVIAVQHHHAHVLSVMAEWGEAGPVVGLACDGTGFGPDRAVWGCEVLLCERGEYKRAGHLEYYPLVGGDAAALDTWRPAAALLRAARGSSEGAVPSSEDMQVFEQQAAGSINAPPTSSLGRVFDAVSFLLGLCSRNRHEAEAAMALEALAADQPDEVEPYAYMVNSAATGADRHIVWHRHLAGGSAGTG
ncbi:MAG: carbamoyltransferase HypF, partial [Phycisphaerae bacterium]|nr:carbamoyltransferase HypF [Phycisphaerae bacterium]